MAAHRAVIPGRGPAAAAAVLALFAAGAKSPEPRRVALRVPEGIAAAPALEKLGGRAKGRGVELQVAPEGTAVPRGFETAHLSLLPPADKLAATLQSRFPIAFEAVGFTFDGHAYTGQDVAVFLSDPARPGEAFVLGASPEAVLELTASRIVERFGPPADFEIASGGLVREGRFAAAPGRLAIDRASERDQIAAKERFYKDLKREKRGALDWESRETEAQAVARLEKIATKYAGKKPFTVRVFPDAVAKALDTGSSRPADLVVEAGRLVVEVDASAPSEPDLIEPAFASAALAAANPALLERRVLLTAAGARRVGRWWGRDVRSFAAFTHAAGVDPSLEDVVRASEDASPILAVGAAAAWLDAGARLDGEALAEKALTEAEGVLATKLSRWRDAAWRQTVKPPARRGLPEGFLRGAAFPMSSSVDGGYVSPASRDTLRRLEELSVNAVSILPYALVKEAGGDRVLFVHRTARGETDEALVRAITDARQLQLSAMLQPQLWVGNGISVGDLSMADEQGWAAWFDAYRRYIVHQAVLSEAAGAALFCAGADLTKSEGQEREWRRLFAAVRLATGAPVVYAANGAAAAANVTFWDALDAIGVDFTDPLVKGEKASDSSLEEGVRRAARPLADLAARVNKPVLFTEAGFAAVKASWMAPRDEDPRRPAGGEDAARAVAAVFRALGKETWWKGVFWWTAPSDGRPAPAGERGLNFLGTPSEKAIADGFRRTAAP